MRPEAARLHEAFIAEFTRQAGSGVGAAVERLDRELRELLSLPVERQRRTPGEVFREAVVAAGLPEVPYAEEAWQAHLAWGAAKAQALSAPAVVYVGNDLMDRSKIAAAA